MKHSTKITAAMVMLFVAAQFAGLFIVQFYTSGAAEYLIAPPENTNKSLGFIPILLAVLIGTGALILLIRLKLTSLWELWFSLSVFVALLLAVWPFLSQVTTSFFLSLVLTICVSALLVWLKKKYLLAHNGTELLIYGGIVSLFIPLLNIVAVWILLILISVYDVIAVRKTKHMVTLAEFQTNSRLFAGLQLQKEKLLPDQIKASKITSKRKKANDGGAVERGESSGPAILGGGDIAFPLLFIAVHAVELQLPFFHTAILIAGATVGLLTLFLTARPGAFYPALPYIGTGVAIAAGAIYGLI